MSFLKSLLADVKAYLVKNPGAVSLVAAGLAMILATFGFHVDAKVLASLLALLIPAVVGVHVAARRAAAKAAPPVK